MELPKSVVFTFTRGTETVLSHLASQILWQGLVVGKLREIFSRLVLFPEDRVQPLKLRLALAWSSPDVLGDRS